MDPKLKAEWDAKLKASGFEDIEQSDGNLKRWDSHYFNQKYTPLSFAARQDYYRMVSEFLHYHKFSDARERDIWERYAEGTELTDIGAELGFTIDQVKKTVAALRKVMLHKCRYKKT